jgi:hypothetical protein
MDEYAGRDFLDAQRGERLAAERAWRREYESGDEAAEQPAQVCESEVPRGISYSVSSGSGSGATSGDLVLRRREAASKDALGGVNEATNWTILREAMQGAAPQDEAVESGAIPKLQLEKLSSCFISWPGTPAMSSGSNGACIDLLSAECAG